MFIPKVIPENSELLVTVNSRLGSVGPKRVTLVTHYSENVRTIKNTVKQVYF